MVSRSVVVGVVVLCAGSLRGWRGGVLRLVSSIAVFSIFLFFGPCVFVWFGCVVGGVNSREGTERGQVSVQREDDVQEFLVVNSNTSFLPPPDHMICIIPSFRHFFVILFTSYVLCRMIFIFSGDWVCQRWALQLSLLDLWICGRRDRVFCRFCFGVHSWDGTLTWISFIRVSLMILP